MKIQISKKQFCFSAIVKAHFMLINPIPTSLFRRFKTRGGGGGGGVVVVRYKKKTPPVHKLIPTDKRDHIFLQKFDHHNSKSRFKQREQ